MDKHALTITVESVDDLPVIRAEGELPLLMTDFGVKPPTAMFGTLRTDNKITVKFSLLVGPQTLTAASAGDRR